MEIKELIERCGISQSYIAKKIGMNRSTLKNKLREGHSAHFTEMEVGMIKTILDGIARKINKYLEETK